VVPLNKRLRLAALGALLLAVQARRAHADTLSVGPGKAYAAPCAAVAAAHDNDVIEIDAAGNYAGDVCAIDKNGLTLRGVGGRAKIDANGQNYAGKATWVISGHDTTVENIELSGATVPDQNGAGIRQEGDNLTVRGCYFHDNDDGILTDASPSSQILIEYSEFAQNGFGDGYSHNMYIGNVSRFTLRYSYSHDSKIGHLVKSRAAENYILYNRLTGEQGTSSYELDLPNAGTSVVLGNLIEQGPNTDNASMLTYGLEGTKPENPGHDLYVVNNTFVDDRPSGGTFVNIGALVDSPAVLQNNVFSGPGTLTNQANAALSTNFSGGDAQLVDSASFDYHLEPGSPCVDRGSAPGQVGDFSLVPTWQYVHPENAQGRVGVGTIDIGAYELGAGNDTSPGGGGGASGGSGQTANGGAAPSAGTANAGNAQAGSAEAQAGGHATSGANSTDSGGCACRASATESHSMGAWLALLAPLVIVVRRRNRV
jgi:hypothetical protein